MSSSHSSASSLSSVGIKLNTLCFVLFADFIFKEKYTETSLVLLLLCECRQKEKKKKKNLNKVKYIVIKQIKMCEFVHYRNRENEWTVHI